MTAEPPPWLDGDAPHDADRSAAQIAGVLRHVGPPPRLILDLACGGGRVLVPLAAAGHALTGIDRDAAALERCRAALDVAGAAADLHEADILGDWPLVPDAHDAALCLGNTIMLLHDEDDLVDLLRRAADRLGPHGVILVDDCPFDFLPELTEGNWQSGISPDGGMQIVWESGDLVFALRAGAAVDVTCWQPRPGETRYRLWTTGELRLAARCAGLSDVVRDVAGGLFVLRRS